MRQTILDIQNKLRQNAYKNEEHVRLNLVLRILEKLEWNIWDPLEVYAEFQTVRSEDSTRVDLALFVTPLEPTIYIEVKTIGGIDTKLSDIERQLRDYNRNNTASFCVITDGQKWRFYLPQTGGEFGKKCFKIIDLLKDELDDIEFAFLSFLQKKEVQKDGNAKIEAEKYLKLNQKQRLMQDCLPEARRLVTEPPYPRLPDALVDLVLNNGFEITSDEATDFIRNSENKPQSSTVASQVIQVYPEPKKTVYPIKRDHVIEHHVAFSKIVEGDFGGQRVSSWNHLVETGIKIALDKRWSIIDLKTILPIKEGYHTTEGYNPIQGTNLSYQNMDANKCWSKAKELAQKLSEKIRIRVYWRNKEGAAYPGQEHELIFP